MIQKPVFSAAVFRTLSDHIFPKQQFNKRPAIERLIEELFAASAAGEEGVYLHSSLIVISSVATLERWEELLHIARVHTDGAFAEHGLGTALRRHAPLLRSTDFGFVAADGSSEQLVGVGTTMLNGLARVALVDHLKKTRAVLIEVFGPLHIRFDNGRSSITFEKGHYRFPADPETDTGNVLRKVTAALDLGRAATKILERLVETLRLLGHGALYIVTDDTVDLDVLFPNSIQAKWDALSAYVGSQPPDFEPTRIVNTYAGFGMMDGAVVLGRDLSLRRYRAYYEIQQDKPVEGGGRSRAFAKLETHIRERKPGLIAAIKISTDGDLIAVTPPE